MTARENYLRCIRFQHPESIPMVFAINPSSWFTYPHDFLFEQMERHRYLFPGYHRPADDYWPVLPDWAKAASRYTDGWGCVWETVHPGMGGTVVHHPLGDWTVLDTYRPPDPGTHNGIEPVDWADVGRRLEAEKQLGRPAVGGLRHNHTFLQLCDIRGYENLLFDMADDEPRLHRLIREIERFNLAIIERYLDLGVDVMTVGEDLGMQTGPMLSPLQFRGYIKPVYRRMVARCREHEVPVHLHSDGHIRDLAEDLIDCGADILNPQDTLNGIDWIAATLKGRVCIDLDIDRQFVTAQGSPPEIDRLIREEVDRLDDESGGLMMVFGLYPGVPRENVVALMDAMERYAVHGRPVSDI